MKKESLGVPSRHGSYCWRSDSWHTHGRRLARMMQGRAESRLLVRNTREESQIRPAAEVRGRLTTDVAVICDRGFGSSPPKLLEPCRWASGSTSERFDDAGEC